MSELKEIHRKAIEIAKQANEALGNGDSQSFTKLSEEAYLLERRAAEMLFNAREAEPTRSVLYRSAATLAFNCGRFEDAQTLIYCGLSGTPYPEIQAELEQLLVSCKEQMELESEPQEIAAISYLHLMRTKAINLKLEPKSQKYSKAIFTEHIIDFLRTINASYTNFATVVFNKSFNTEAQESSKMLDSFLKQSKPLCVNLGFNSFGVSIIADNETMFNSEFYSKKFNDWRTTVFTEYKQDVILPDYNSQSFLETISKKYTEEERQLIYAPIVDKMKQTTPYKFTVTESNFKTEIKPYKQLEKASREILNPPKQRTQPIPEQKVVTRSIDLVNASGKGRKKNLQFETLENAEWKLKFNDFESRGRTLTLKDEYVIMVKLNVGVFSIEDGYLEISTTSNDYDILIDQYMERIVEFYASLLEKVAEAIKLNADEQTFFEHMEEIVFSRNW